MNTVPVPQPRGRIEDLGNEVRVALPPRRNVLMMLFLIVWFGGWCVGEATAIRQITAAGGPANAGFLVIWLAAWSVGGALAVFTLTWMTLGNELLELRPDVLVHRRQILGRGLTRSYDLANVKNLRVGPATPGFIEAATKGKQDLSRAMEAWGLGGGPIVFDYGSRTIRCGAALDEAEARQIIDRFGQRDARLRPPAA